MAALVGVLAIAAQVRADGPPPAAPPSAVDAEDAYAAAAQQLQSADAALVRARQQAVLAFRSGPDYVKGSEAVDKAFDAFAEKRNPLLMAADQHDPRFGTWRKAAADADAEIARAGQPGTALPPDKFDDLLKERANFAKQLSAAEDDAVDRDPDAKRLRQQWLDACARLRQLQDKQPAAVEGSEGVKSALAVAARARAAADRARSALPSPATADPAEPSVDELARRYPRHGLGWNDPWLSTGNASAPAAGK